MENEELLEQTNETENVDTQTTEENVEGIDLTDTTDENQNDESEKEKVKKTLRELLDENPEYQNELNETIIKPRLARKDREFQKEISKYKDIENVLKNTIGGNDINEINQNLREAYKSQGVELPDRYSPGLSSREIEVLAKADAEDFIHEGYDSMVNEANRLASKRYENLDERERIIFNTLAETLTAENNRRELLKLGAKEELLKNADFIAFKNMFHSKTPVKDVYEMYMRLQPKKNFENPGSMKNDKLNQPKTYYTDEEISKLTLEDLDKPGVFEAVRKSMTGE